MKKIYFGLLLGFGLVATTNAQSLERQVIGAAGGFDTGGGVSLSYTVGEPVVETAITGSVILTQGFQQPDDLNTGVKEVQVSLEYTVFPNPTDDKIFIDLKSDKAVDVVLSMYDISGKRLDFLTINSSISQTKSREEMSLKTLASGQYILVLTDKAGNSLKNFKIQKLN